MIICSFSVASTVKSNRDLGFSAMWSLFMVVAVAIGGTMVFRKYQTEGAIGFLVGVCAMMGQVSERTQGLKTRSTEANMGT